MNLQRLIDQHPSVFAAIFPIYFLCLWFLVGAIISFIGGWFSLAKVYRTRLPFNGAKWRMQSGRMRWLANYNNVLTLGVTLKTVSLIGGAVKFTTSTLTPGTHSITATYNGSTSFIGSSGSLTQTVN